MTFCSGINIDSYSTALMTKGMPFKTTLFKSSMARTNILVVDDEPLVRWTLESRLTKAGFNVTTYSNAEEAIKKLGSTQQDLLITDLKLPDADGFEVATAAKRYLPSLPIIMISTFGDDLSRQKAKRSGIECFMDKPFDLDDLVIKVRDLLDRTSK